MSNLYILPNTLGCTKTFKELIPPAVAEAVANLDGLIAESPQSGRSFLNQFKTKKPPYDIPLAILNKHTKEDEIDFFLKPIKEGQNWGLISDAGLPCFADPGSKLVFRARQLGISVKAIPGPSAIVMAIQLCGLFAQRFAFNGYIAKEPKKRDNEILALQKRSLEEGSLQIFIEAPYRNQHTLDSLLQKLKPSTMLAIAWDLTLESEGVISQKVESIKKMKLPNIDKKPAIFIIDATKS